LRTPLTEQAPSNPPKGEHSEGEPRRESERDAELPRIQNTFTNVRAGDDSCQLIVSTTGVVIGAKNVSTGNRTSHGMGQMSDQSIQLLLRRNEMSTTEQPTEREGTADSSFDQYGTGHSLAQR
jgi:hypothetical protein